MATIPPCVPRSSFACNGYHGVFRVSIYPRNSLGFLVDQAAGGGGCSCVSSYSISSAASHVFCLGICRSAGFPSCSGGGRGGNALVCVELQYFFCGFSRVLSWDLSIGFTLVHVVKCCGVVKYRLMFVVKPWLIDFLASLLFSGFVIEFYLLRCYYGYDMCRACARGCYVGAYRLIGIIFLEFSGVIQAKCYVGRRN